jgi:hypothetical protein
MRVEQRAGITPLGAILTLSFFISLGTGVFWNGLSFIAKHGYGFSQERNLVLYGVMGFTYTIAALQAGRFTRLVERRLSARAVLALAIAFQSVLCLGPVAIHAEWALWFSVTGVVVTSAFIWPLTESYLTAGRHGAEMRSAIGWFNLTWMSAVALPLLAMGPLLEHYARWSIGGMAFASLAALAPIVLFTRKPQEHDLERAGTHVQPEYPMLLQSARILLPLSYVLNSAMSPILPYRFEAIGVDIWWETPTTATWMVVRVLALIVMMRMAFWHGRWGALLAGAVAMTVGFGLIVAGANLLLMLTGFACLGTGLGIVYFAALYYAMSVGHAQVDAGGKHEALIGSGYAVGPVAGLVGTALGGPTYIVGSVWSIVAMSAIPAFRPYVLARRRRRAR